MIFEKHLESKFKEIWKWWENLTGIELEEVQYKKVVRANINNYLAVSVDGKIKRKGLFKYDTKYKREIPLGDSVDFLVIPKLLEQYFVNNIRPEVILESLQKAEEYGLHIYDFCCSMKCDKSYIVEWNGKKQQRLNRFFVSKNGAYLYKTREGKKYNMLKGWGVQLYNRHENKPLSEYNLDTKFYLQAVNKLISEIERNQQLTLF